MDVWVQGSLFDLGEPREAEAGNARTSSRSAGRARARPTPSRSRVTRDPAVAMSYGEGVRLAADFRVGLARAYGRLTPEQRLAIRSAVGLPPRRAAA